MMNLPPAVSASSRNMAAPSSIFDGAVPAVVKTKMCNKYNSAEDCKFGNKCHFAHGEWELGKPTVPVHDDPRVMGNVPGRFGDRMESPSAVRAASFGVSATAEISVDASLAGAIIGKAGVNSKQICWQTGAKLSIRDHESDPNLRNIELEGNFDQIKRASAMVRELISRIGPIGGPPKGQCGPGNPKGNIKTKLCENFAKGSCTFGDRCHFAHGNAELRKPGVEGFECAYMYRSSYVLCFG